MMEICRLDRLRGSAGGRAMARSGKRAERRDEATWGGSHSHRPLTPKSQTNSQTRPVSVFFSLSSTLALDPHHDPNTSRKLSPLLPPATGITPLSSPSQRNLSPPRPQAHKRTDMTDNMGRRRSVDVGGLALALGEEGRGHGWGGWEENDCGETKFVPWPLSAFSADGFTSHSLQICRSFDRRPSSNRDHRQSGV